jgi:hypothetical protein
MTLGSVASGPAVFPLASLDTSEWCLVGVELITLVFVIIFGFRPQPPLHQQYASREEAETNKAQEERHNRELWEVINGLRGAVASIKTDVGQIKTLREANGDRLDELSRELLQLIKEVATLNERTKHGNHGIHSDS